ncbi:PREDICTED: protein NRDE2 homolog [Ceratosolen solmsi marchali]|uniref:Protein NRDE2 homolog n=1 Tax=Ceratosolen solmsi marchali TaxID=326594 RepID=A0AAJ7DYB7_9HYME|nr:PREDICTED: protein NRDE2 homolog [Ceratosolen solmsi marchali]
MDELKDEQKVLIQKFNKRITECPKDINAWLEYVQFQDQVIESCSFYKQKNIKEIITQKKLTIIEKALAINYDSVELLNLKLQLLSMSIPADQFLNKIEEMIKHDKKNIILWEALIKLTQTSCVLCKVSKVLDSYVKYFSVLKQKCKTSPKFYDEQIFNLLYQCLIFLRHVGLWEQMWEILKINLHLNLEIDREKLKNINTIDEKLIMDMEELILNSKLPLNQLWLRIELLRERCFWTSVDINQVNVNLIGDEKRLVSADEITNFIYPTITIESNFRLVIFTLLCLKVPLLPSRHCTFKDFKLEKDCWTIDSLECILPMIYSTVWIGAVDKYLSNKFMLTSLFEGELTSGPQFIKYHPAQELYLDFIRLIFSTISQKLPIIQRTSILIWWLRFERLLIFITKDEPLKEESKNKKAKSIIKNFLKKPENRNNLHFYREFALFEYELGSFDNCIYMLRKIIQSQDIKFLDNEEKAALLSLYRTSFEILLDLSTYKNSNLEIFNEMTESLKNFICVCFNYNQNMTVEEILYEEIIKFLTNSVADESEDTFLLPNLHCDLLICYSYILYSKNRIDTNSIFELFNRCLTHCNKCFRLQERFYETKVAFLQFLQHTVQKVENVLINTLNEALEKYPSNLFLLSLNASIESKLPYWKLKTSNKRYNIWSILANCLAGRARIIHLNNIGLEQSSNAMINKMLSFHKTLSITEEVQNCPLVWRFYMLLLREHDLSKNKGEEIYFQAVTQCPWSRSVYISAAEIAPQILSQIQDLIQEKELRIHVTPDELDILRG